MARVIVTISRDYGAAGLAVADTVSVTLGYELLTDDVWGRVAAKLGTSAREVSERASGERSLPERLLAGLGDGTPELADPNAPLVDFDDSVRAEIEAAIRERALRGNVVILGRYAGAVLGRRPGVLRVFLGAGFEWRVARILASLGGTRPSAIAEIERVDAARRKIARERYGFAWGDARSYDLALDVSAFGIEGAAALVVAAVHSARGAA